MQKDSSKGNGRDVSNIGIVGIESIRIGGMTLNTLPMAEAAITKQQWSEVEASNKKQEVENILGKYPKATIVYLESRAVECLENIGRIRGLINDQNKMINEYSAQISLCAHRDAEIYKLNPEKDKDKIKALKLQFPPYDVVAMRQQIKQCLEAITRSDKVIDQENASILELRDTISLCRQRDEALKPFGVQVA